MARTVLYLKGKCVFFFFFSLEVLFYLALNHDIRGNNWQPEYVFIITGSKTSCEFQVVYIFPSYVFRLFEYC